MIQHKITTRVVLTQNIFDTNFTKICNGSKDSVFVDWSWNPEPFPLNEIIAPVSLAIYLTFSLFSPRTFNFTWNIEGKTSIPMVIFSYETYVFLSVNV